MTWFHAFWILWVFGGVSVIMEGLKTSKHTIDNTPLFQFWIAVFFCIVLWPVFVTCYMIGKLFK